MSKRNNTLLAGMDDVLQGARSEGDSLTHSADCTLVWDLTALPTTGAAALDFRRLDDDSKWQVAMYATGNFALTVFDNDAGTLKANAVSALAGGERIVITATGGTIKGYYDGALAWTVSDTTHQTETGGLFKSDGSSNDGALTNIVAYPYNGYTP